MPTGTEILSSKEWQNASQAEREKIFARKIAKDKDYANQSADVQKLIYERFFPSAEEEPVVAEATDEEPVDLEEAEEEPEGLASYPAIEGTPASVESTETKSTAAPFRKDTAIITGAAAGASIPTLLQKYFAAPDKLQRDLYENAIKNVLAKSGIDVTGFKGSDLIAEARRFISQQPLGAEEKLAGLKAQVEGLRAVQPSVSTGFPSSLDDLAQAGRASSPKVDSGSAKWMGSQIGAGEEIPFVRQLEAEGYRKDTPTGGQRIIDEDRARRQKIAQLGGGDYRLVGQGSGQLMLPPEAGAQKMAREAQVAREALAIILPQISALESQIARMQASGQDVSNLIAQLEELRRAEGSAKQLTKGLKIPSESGLGMTSRLGIRAVPTTPTSAAGAVLGHTLGGVGAGFNLATALDESEDLISRGLAGVSGAFDLASLVPPVGPFAFVKGAGMLGGLGMLPVQAGYEYLSPETKQNIKKKLRIPSKSVMDKK